MRERNFKLKSARLVARRRRALITRAILTILGLVLLWTGLFFISSLKYITIDSVKVVGTSPVSSTYITETAKKLLEGRYFYTIPRSNIFFYPKRKIEQAILEAYPRIENVAVGYNNFHSIDIAVVERATSAIWCQGSTKTLSVVSKSGENCYEVDSTGMIFAPHIFVATSTDKFITLYSANSKEEPIKQNFVDAQFFQKLLNFADDLSQAGYTTKSFSERADGDFEATLYQGQRLIFSKDSDLSLVLSNLQTIVSAQDFIKAGGFSKVDYFDLRFGNKVYYKQK